MPIDVFLVLNGAGRTRLRHYAPGSALCSEGAGRRLALEEEIRRLVARDARDGRVATIAEGPAGTGGTILWRRYASLVFVVGFSGENENEAALEECIHAYVEALNSFFALTGGQVCELDFISHLEDCEAILNEMVVNGWACPLSAESALAPTLAMRRAAIAQHGGGAGGSSAVTTGAASRRA